MRRYKKKMRHRERREQYDRCKLVNPPIIAARRHNKGGKGSHRFGGIPLIWIVVRILLREKRIFDLNTKKVSPQLQRVFIRDGRKHSQIWTSTAEFKQARPNWRKHGLIWTSMGEFEQARLNLKKAQPNLYKHGIVWIWTSTTEISTTETEQDRPI